MNTNKTKKIYPVRNGKELTEKEYKIYLEGMAEGVWRATDQEMYGKWHDPLYINSLDDVYSYAFDFHDGGRHHKFNSLDELHEALVKEAEKNFV